MGLAQRTGSWLLPAPGLGVDRARVQRRAGAVGLLIVIAAVGIAVGAILSLVLHPGSIAQVTGPGVALMTALALAFVLALVSVPPAIFRTRSREQTERLLASPSSRLRSWSRTTMAIDLLPAAVMVGAVYFAPDFVLAVLAAALLARAMIRSRRQVAHDPDARFAALLGSGSALASVGAITAIVSPLSAQVLADRGPAPFLLAACAVVLVDVATGALDRWVRMDDPQWASVRDLVDPRRWVIALVLAVTAWAAVWVAEAITAMASAEMGNAAGLLVLAVTWATVWIVALVVWQVEARRIMRQWAVHQGKVLMAVEGGALERDLAARAAVAVVARMAVTAFGAGAVVVALPDGTRHAIDVDDCRAVESAELAALPHSRVRIAASPLDPAIAELLVIEANTPGRVALGSAGLRTDFTTLALATLTVPRLAAAQSPLHQSPLHPSPSHNRHRRSRRQPPRRGPPLGRTRR